jgi:hypothetical protein
MPKKGSSPTGKSQEGEDSHDMPGTDQSMESVDEATIHEYEDLMPGESAKTDYVSGDDMPGGKIDDDAASSDGQPTPTVRKCGTMDVHRRLLSQDPSYARLRDQIENETRAFSSNGASTARPGVTRIPVVVHVVWNTAPQNLSEAQIKSQIDVLNRDFRRTNPDVSSTPAPFLPFTADARIEFFLANIDPNGAPTNGITRQQTTQTAFSDNDGIKSATTGGTDPWPANRYLNIWTAPRLTSSIGDLLGYAQFPGGPAATDGVVILHSAFGTNGTAATPFHLGRTATHEIGHYFNLNHIWGDDGVGCSGTDNVSDTPNQGGSNFGVPTFPHTSCSNGPNGDMFMNYMDYVDDRAMFMFTAGQVTRMQACLDGPRNSIGVEALAATPRQSSSPVVAWGPDRLDVFEVDTDRRLYHKWWNGSAWGPSLTAHEDLAGICISRPQVVSWRPDRLDVFVVGTDSALYHKWWNGSAWGPSLTGYERLGGLIIGEPRVVSWGPDRLDVFVVGTDSALYHKWWNGSAWGPSLTGYERLGDICIGQPEAVSWGPNRLDVFVVGSDGALHHKWWNGSSWGPSLTGYENLGGTLISSPRVVSWGPNRLDVFAIGTDSELYHKWWNGSSWGPSLTGWERMGGICVTQPEAVAWGPNRLDVFVVGIDGGLFHKWWDGSNWRPSLTGFEAIGGICTSVPRVTSWGANRLDVFVTGTDSALFHKWWNGSSWGPSMTGYERLGGTIALF